jgi:hypothetical protein
MDNRVITKKVWVKPTVKLIAAGSAETGPANNNPDGNNNDRS